MLYYYPALEDKSVQLTQYNSHWLCPDEFDVQDNRGYLLPGVGGQERGSSGQDYKKLTRFFLPPKLRRGS